MNTTIMQQAGLKALSIAILTRNRQRNQNATSEKTPCNFTLEKKQQSCTVSCTSPAVQDELEKAFPPDYVNVPPTNGGRDLPHYCTFYPGGSWCSEKLPDANYPAGCIRLKCEHYKSHA